MVYFGTYENPSAFVKAYYADKLAGLPSIIREQIDYLKTLALEAVQDIDYTDIDNNF